MLAFSTTSNLLEKKNNRIEGFKKHPGNENKIYSLPFNYTDY
jgi:hypothetical protein